MKKVYLVLALLFAFAAPNAFAQITNSCDPNFGIQLTNSSTIQLTPVINVSSPEIHHNWYFGDGGFDNSTAPTHTYGASGVYTVKHYLYRTNANGTTPTCIDSATQVVTIVLQCNLTAQFTSQTTATNPLGVQFTNTSLNFNTSDSIRWTFGDGTVSYDVNPYHVYANGGTYNVCLRVKRNGLANNCVSEICHTVTVVAPFTCNLSVSFTSQSTPNGANVINFTNTSTGYASGDTIRWNFGDGTSSTAVSPSHVYTAAGTYHVCLTIIRVVPPGVAPCQNTICHEVVITSPCNLTAAYTGTPAANNPLEIHFQNTSAGYNAGDSIRWSFGDGTYSFDVNPTHVYANAGTYTICLWVKKNNAASALPCVSEICHTITVLAPCNQHAMFTYSTTGGGHYVFTNTSTGMISGDSTIWTFGDGTHAYGYNADHTFTTSGSYTVCLKVKRNQNNTSLSCQDDTCITIAVVITNPCNLQASFTAQSTATQPNHWVFTNTSIGYAAGDSVTWSFGDGTYAYGYNADHTYTANGNYTVCVRIKKNTIAGTTPCIREYCRTISVTLPTTCNLHASFHDSLITNTNTHYFMNTTTPFNANDSVRWTFGDGTSSNASSAVHTYQQPGTYNVCIRVQQRNPNGVLTNCVSEYCHQVTVVQLCNVNPSFTHAASSPNSLLISFNNTTIAPAGATAHWSFGDGTANVAGWNQTHQYANAGSYNVCLRVEYNGCVSYHCDSFAVYAPQASCTQLANYHRLTTSAAANSITVTPNNIFNDVQYTWTFGDGTGSHDITASHTYAAPGTYTVCLTAYRNNTCAATSCQSVTVTQAPPTTNCAVQVYPNPASTEINAVLSLTQPLLINAYIYNSLNVLVAQKQQQGIVGVNTVSMNIASLPGGVYVIRLVYGNQVCYVTFVK